MKFTEKGARENEFTIAVLLALSLTKLLLFTYKTKEGSYKI